MNLKSRIEKIRELDKRRTQGDWKFHESPAKKYTETLTGASHYNEPYYAVECNGDAICDNAGYYPQSVGEGDCAYIAAMPEAISIINAQAEMLEKMDDVLDMLSKHPIATWYSGEYMQKGYYASWDDAEYAVKQALTDYKNMMEGGDGS